MRRLATRWLLCSASLGGRIKNTYESEVTVKIAQSNTFNDVRVFLMHVKGVSLSCGAVTRASLSLPPSRAWLLQLAPLCIGSCQTARAGHKRDPAVVLRHTYTKWAWLPLTCNMGHTRTHTYTHTDSCQLEPLKINMKTTMTSYYVSWGE